MQNNGKLVARASSPSEGQALRLLCVEDNPRDVKLIAGILKKAGYRLAAETVDESSLFRSRLELAEYDVITCDFDLNGWNAIDALDILKESGKDVPLLVVSGTLDDEAAVECIKHGATDYVIKDRMARLPSAIQRALEGKLAREEQRAAALALRESAEQYRLLFEANPNPMWVFDVESHAILAENDAAVQHYGYALEEFAGMNLRDLGVPEEIPNMLDRIEKSANQNVPMGSMGVSKHRKKSGALIEVEVASSPILFQGRSARLVLANDVTERNSLQAELLQARKMESLGRLAGGVAHDLNNLMGVVLGYAELTLDHLDQTSPLRRKVEGMQKAAERAVSIVRQLLAFSRSQIQRPQMISLNTVLEDMEELLQRLIGDDIGLSIVTAPNLGTVKADPGQIEQIILNLVVNARDAMPRGGELTLSTANADDVCGTDTTHQLDSPSGPLVILSVRDTGCGMDPGTQAKIFEPFFTTKGPGKGTGLGLATVYGIVKQSGGGVSVHSELGHGATFRICLPRVEAPAQPHREITLSGEIPKGSETVLLVEDAEPLREVIRRFLQQGGYTVLVAEDGIAALTSCREHNGPIDLLLTDVVMPGLSGPQLAKEIGLLRPGMPVLYMSGYTDEAIGPHGALEEGIALLEKPFTRGSLLRKLREVLDRVLSSSQGKIK